MKGLSIRKTEAAYPRLMYYTAAFVLKQLCHSEGVLCSLSGELDSSMTGFILRDYSVFILSANGRLCLTTCPFLLGDLANSETRAFISSKCLNFVDAKQFFELQRFVFVSTVMHTCLVILRLSDSSNYTFVNKKCYFR